MANKDGEYITFNEHELLNNINENRSKDSMKVIGEIDRELAKENRMTEDQIILEKMSTIQETNRMKSKFIDEIKGGLGNQIKLEPTKIKKVKKNKSFMCIIRDIFTKF